MPCRICPRPWSKRIRLPAADEIGLQDHCRPACSNQPSRAAGSAQPDRAALPGHDAGRADAAPAIWRRPSRRDRALPSADYADRRGDRRHCRRPAKSFACRPPRSPWPPPRTHRDLTKATRRYLPGAEITLPYWPGNVLGSSTAVQFDLGRPHYSTGAALTAGSITPSCSSAQHRLRHRQRNSS